MYVHIYTQIHIHICRIWRNGGVRSSDRLIAWWCRAHTHGQPRAENQKSLTQCRDKFAHHSLIQTVSHSRSHLKIKAGLIGLAWIEFGRRKTCGGRRCQWKLPEENERCRESCCWLGDNSPASSCQFVVIIHVSVTRSFPDACGVVKCQHLQCTNVKDDSQQHASRKGHWIAAVSVATPNSTYMKFPCSAFANVIVTSS